MLVKFSGRNFSSFLICPGGPVRLGGKEGAGERSRREPAGSSGTGPAARAPRRRRRATHQVARHRQCRRAMERPEDMAMAGSLAETIFACHTSRLGTLNALSGAGRGTRGPAGGRRPPAVPHARRPGCQAPGTSGGAASEFPRTVNSLGATGAGPAAPPAPAPPRPRPRAPPRAPLTARPPRRCHRGRAEVGPRGGKGAWGRRGGDRAGGVFARPDRLCSPRREQNRERGRAGAINSPASRVWEQEGLSAPVGEELAGER